MRKTLFLSAFLAVGGFVLSQNYLNSNNILSKSTDQNGNVTFISFKEKSLIESSAAEAVLKEVLNFDQNNTLLISKTNTDKNGGVHVFYKHYYKGVEVFGNNYVVHTKNGKINSINGNFNNISLESTANLNSQSVVLNMGLANLEPGYVGQASQLPADIKAQLPVHLQNESVKGHLTILPKSITKTADRYVYVFNLVNAQTGAVDKVFVDAIDGSILKKDSLLKFLNHRQNSTSVLTKEQHEYFHTYVWNQNANILSLSPSDAGTAETRYSGVKPVDTKAVDEGYILIDESRFVRTKNFQNNDYIVLAFTIAFGGDIEQAEADMTIDFVDNDNNWTAAEHEANKNDGALDAHWAFSQSYDYFKDEFDRDGFDNANSLVRSYVHVTFFGNPSNAAWLDLMGMGGEGGVMLVGDGDYDAATGTGTYDIFSTLDVMSHEFAHGINRAGGGLVYEKESGALDEGFADMWGATIEADRAPEKDRWTIAEDNVHAEPAGVRSFRNPKLFNQPNTYNGEFYIPTEGCTPSQDNDQCGVHTNSGVPNYWYYLISDGGSGTNDHGYNYAVNGFGIEKAGKLIYAVQENYVQSNSGFADIMNFTIQEAGVQYGETSLEVNTVKAAWCAVGVAAPESEVCTTLGTDDLTAGKFSVYPNPVVDILNIKTTKATQNLKYKINNIAGQLIQQGEISNGKINVNILPKGVYVLSLSGDNFKETTKFIKK